MGYCVFVSSRADAQLFTESANTGKRLLVRVSAGLGAALLTVWRLPGVSGGVKESGVVGMRVERNEPKLRGTLAVTAEACRRALSANVPWVRSAQVKPAKVPRLQAGTRCASEGPCRASTLLLPVHSGRCDLPCSLDIRASGDPSFLRPPCSEGCSGRSRRRMRRRARGQSALTEVE